MKFPLHFFLLIFFEILVSGELSIISPCLPSIHDEFNISVFNVELLLSLNVLTQCIFSLIIGHFIDFYEKRIIVIISLIIFILGCLICYHSVTYNSLLIGRIVQGIGISGPVVMFDVLSVERRKFSNPQQLMGLVYGFSTIVLIFTPIIASYINILFGWRKNFLLLLFLSLISLTLSYLYIPQKTINKEEVPIYQGYLEILASKKVILCVGAISFFLVPYWIFMAMAPIFYVKGLGISLESYSLYQSSTAVSFALISFIYSYLVKKLGAAKCFSISTLSLICFVILIIYILKYNISNPLLIILAVHILTISTVFTYNILIPIVLEIIPNNKGRISAITNVFELTVASITLQISSFFYKGTFHPIGVAMIIAIIIAFSFYYKLRQEARLSAKHNTT